MAIYKYGHFGPIDGQITSIERLWLTCLTFKDLLTFRSQRKDFAVNNNQYAWFFIQEIKQGWRLIAAARALARLPFSNISYEILDSTDIIVSIHHIKFNICQIQQSMDFFGVRRQKISEMAKSMED
jgi:hypothetical protein